MNFAWLLLLFVALFMSQSASKALKILSTENYVNSPTYPSGRTNTGQTTFSSPLDRYVGSAVQDPERPGTKPASYPDQAFSGSLPNPTVQKIKEPMSYQSDFYFSNLHTPFDNSIYKTH